MNKYITFQEDVEVKRSRRYSFKMSPEFKEELRQVIEDYLEFVYVKSEYSNYQICDSIKVRDVKITDLSITFSSEVECHNNGTELYATDTRPTNQLSMRVENG